MPVPPPTAYPAGTRLTVGSHEVEIDKFIGEGGFAHVYTVRTTPPIPGHEVACLKRVQVPNKAYLNLLRAEVDAMQRLKGAPNIVQYVDSHAERMHGPQAQGHYEVFLLMEFCDRGGLIDFMNQRLSDRLREHEILKIMYDITLGLSQMHYLSPPLLHRDLKIENVLITGDGTFKLCDFGSVSPVLRPPKTSQEFQILEDDIQHHTTVQYRAPEMVAIARGHPIDEKSDIWAMGIFLYKLCFYTTPFERPNQTLEQFQQLILGGVFTIPPRPAYSERLRNMIRVLLQPDPRMRPNVFQLMQEICAMRRVDCPIKDIYAGRPTQSVPSIAGEPPSQDSLALSAQMVPQPPASVPACGAGAAAASAQGGFMQQPGAIPGAIPGVLGSNVFPQNMPASTSASSQSMPLPAPAGGSSSHLQQPQLPPRPAPGQVPVPGVLLTSPMMTPTSPMSRAMSPLDDEEHITARFPSLEELDRPEPSSLMEFGELRSSQPPPPKLPQKHQKPLNLPPKLPPKLPHDRQSSEEVSDYPMPHRPNPKSMDEESLSAKAPSAEAAKLKQILTGLSGKSSTVIMDAPPDNKNLSSVDFLRTLQTSADDSHTHHHHSFKGHKVRKPSLHKLYYHESKLKAAERDRYNDEDDEDDDDDDDDEDSAVLRLPRQDATYKKLGNTSLKPELEEYNVDHKYDLDPRDNGVRTAVTRDDSEDDSFNFSDADSISPLVSPSQLVPTSPQAPPNKPSASSKPLIGGTMQQSPDQGIPLRNPSSGSAGSSAGTASGMKPQPPKLITNTKPKLDLKKPGVGGSRIEDSSSLNTTSSSGAVAPAAKKPIRSTTEGPLLYDRKPRPKSMIVGSNELASQTTGDLETFKPSHSIQQRVHSFLNSHDRQHPPRRTAKGYGRFTDQIGQDISDDENTLDSMRQTRSRSLGDTVPPTPSKASKPKVKP